VGLLGVDVDGDEKPWFRGVLDPEVPVELGAVLADGDPAPEPECSLERM
jgi:hypothetical protein